MRIYAAVQNDWLGVVRLAGELDAYTGAEFREVMETLLGNGARFMLVDLTGLEYLDSVGLGIMIGGAKHAASRGGCLAVACDRENVRRIFDVSGTGALLNVCGSLEEAVGLLEAKRVCTGAARKDRESQDASS